MMAIIIMIGISTMVNMFLGMINDVDMKYMTNALWGAIMLFVWGWFIM